MSHAGIRGGGGGRWEEEEGRWGGGGGGGEEEERWGGGGSIVGGEMGRRRIRMNFRTRIMQPFPSTDFDFVTA